MSTKKKSKPAQPTAGDAETQAGPVEAQGLIPDRKRPWLAWDVQRNEQEKRKAALEAKKKEEAKKSILSPAFAKNPNLAWDLKKR
jgi:hypothetical protein